MHRKGKAKGGRKSGNPSQSSTATVSAMTKCNLPEKAVVSILTRLPVKSLLRFKCVCKPWLVFISSSKFIAMHRDQSSNNPQNHSLVIHSIDEDFYHNISLLNVNSVEKQPVNVINPFPVLFYQMDLVGSINGLVCLSCPPLGQMIMLWNPAINQAIGIRLPKRGAADPDKISLGLGYDPLNDDYKVVRIACLNPKGSRPKQFLRVQAEVYSAKLDSWKKVQVDFPFVVTQTRCNIIAKGCPYWTGFISESKDDCKFCEVLLWYDVKNEVFKHVSMPRIDMHSGIGVRFVEWKGNLASLVYSPTKELIDYVDVLVYDEGGACWKKKSTHGPIALKMERHMQCSKDGLILAETPEGKLFLYDTLTNGIKECYIAGAQKRSYEAFSHTESLVSLKGMEEVVKQDKEKYCFNPNDYNPEEEDYGAESFMSVLSFVGH